MGNVSLLAACTVAIGLANYGLSLAVLRVLPVRAFSDFTAAQSLLLVLGTGSLSAIPWAVARFVALNEGRAAVRQAMHFGLTSASWQGAALGAVGLGICWGLGGPEFGGAAFLAAFMISLLACPIGLLQGEGRLAEIAALRSIETGARVTATLLLVTLVRPSAAIAVLGFPIGSLTALVYGLYRCRHGFPLERLPRAQAFGLVRQAFLLGSIQILLSMLGALDSVYADASPLAAGAVASYQSATIVTRIPLYLSNAISTACYTPLVSAPDEAAAGARLRPAWRSYWWLSLAFVLGCLTLPAGVLHLLVPAKYSGALSLIRISCFTGVAIGAINVLTTAHQARARYRPCIRILAVAVAVQAVALLGTGRLSTVYGFAAAGVVVCAVALAVLAVDGRRWLTRPKLRPRFAFPAALASAGFSLVVSSPVVWFPATAVTALAAASAGLRGPAPGAVSAGTGARRHLARSGAGP